MVEYINILGGGSDLSLEQILSSLMDFFKSPAGWAFIAVIVTGFWVVRR
jgi:hypothetical protein